MARGRSQGGVYNIYQELCMSCFGHVDGFVNTHPVIPWKGSLAIRLIGKS